MLEIIFTAEDFYVDKPSSEMTAVQSKWYGLFTADKFKALYELGFDAELKTVEKTPSFNFLYFLAERFIEFLTGIPEIELTRGKLEASMPEDIKNSLLNSVPFALGSEFINEEWLANIFNNGETSAARLRQPKSIKSFG